MKGGSVRQRAVAIALGALALAVPSRATAGDDPDPETKSDQIHDLQAGESSSEPAGTPEAGPTLAEDTRVSRARDAAIAGLDAFDQGRYAEAEAKLVEAYALVKVPTLALYLARVYARQGKWVEALEYFSEAQALVVDRGDEATQVAAQADARREGEALRARVPLLRVKLEGTTSEPITASVDGESVPWGRLEEGFLVNPGWRQIEVWQGDRIVREGVKAEVGQEHEVVLRFEQARPEQPAATFGDELGDSKREQTADDWRAVGWASVGIGAAGITIGTVTGVWAWKLRGRLDDQCPGKACPPPYHDDVDTYGRLRTASTVAFIVGGIGLAGGVTLLLKESDASTPTSRLRVDVGLGQARVSGSF